MSCEVVIWNFYPSSTCCGGGGLTKGLSIWPVSVEFGNLFANKVEEGESTFWPASNFNIIPLSFSPGLCCSQTLEHPIRAPWDHFLTQVSVSVCQLVPIPVSCCPGIQRNWERDQVTNIASPVHPFLIRARLPVRCCPLVIEAEFTLLLRFDLSGTISFGDR